MKRLSSGRNRVMKMPMPIQNRINPMVLLIMAGPRFRNYLLTVYAKGREIEKNKNLFLFCRISGIITIIMYHNREVFVCRDRLIRNLEVF